MNVYLTIGIKNYVSALSWYYIFFYNTFKNNPLIRDYNWKDKRLYVIGVCWQKQSMLRPEHVLSSIKD